MPAVTALYSCDIIILFCLDANGFLPLCYDSNLTISAYSIGVVTRIIMATIEGPECEKGKEEVEDIGGTVVESLLLMDHSSLSENMVPFKV